MASTRPIDEPWPAVGTAPARTIAVGRWSHEGCTVVRRHEPPPDWLEPEARSGRLGTARVGIGLRTWGEQTLVIVDEHPLRGFGGTVHLAPLESSSHCGTAIRRRTWPRTVDHPSAAGVAGATAAA
ncbi:SRPBCC family protein [Streptomyces sp. PmtA]|uniref:SRPBCC family protein n=1 Tax=Streptomyces sp. PmtA TaxID=3074275 RepID=UPI00301563F3